jgi:hypothetical protein
MQFHNQVVDPTIQQWVGGDPSYFNEQETNTTVRQLDRNHRLEHPWRAGTRQIVGPGNQYIWGGRWTYRAEIAAAAAIDDWRLWPRLNLETGPEVDATLITCFRIIAGTNDAIVWTENAIPYVITIAAGYYNPTTLAAALVAAMAAAGPSVNTYTWTWNQITRVWTVTRTGGADAFGFSWTDPACTIATLLGFTADDVGAITYTGDTASPLGMPLYRAEPYMKWSLTVFARNSVRGNRLRIRVAGMDAAFGTASYLDPDGSSGVLTLPSAWVATAQSFEFPMAPWWEEYSVNFVTHDQRYFLWEISNGTAGAQNLDVGEIVLSSPVDKIADQGRA